MKRRWLLLLVPLVAAGAAILPAAAGWLPNPFLYLHATVAFLVALVGLALTGLTALLLWRDQRAETRYRRHSEEARAEAAEERYRFLRRLDHELKNPLAIIRTGLVNLAAGQISEQQEILASVQPHILRLSRLTSDLRKLAEMETRPLERTAVKVDDLLREALEMVQEQPGAQDRRVALNLPRAPWPLPAISADRDLVLLAVYSLLDNAFKFTRPGDTIEVRAMEDGEGVTVEVADTGPGIPEEELPLVFEELYRGQGAREIPGSGLGLTLARAIITHHGGHFALRSRVGEGTVATIRLPIGPAPVPGGGM